MSLSTNKSPQNYGHKTIALPHQVEAISYIARNEEVALFDEQGLGKTKIVIEALCSAMESGEIEGVLVIAPMSLLYNWEQEVKKHSYLVPIVLRGAGREKRYKFLTGANFYITNYEAVVAEQQRIKRFCKGLKVAIVLDESGRIKDPTTQTAQALFNLRDLSKRRIIISGTPVANKPEDLWGQFFFLDGGKLLGDSYENFKAKFNEKNGSYSDELLALQHLITANSIRRCKSNVLELPEKRFYNLYVCMGGQQLKMYNTLREELRLEITNIEGERIIDESENILKKLLRLTQLASNPNLIDRKYKDDPTKFIKLDEIMEEIIARNEKAIVWTAFVENILILKNRYRKHNPLIIYGDVPIKDRAQVVKDFQDVDRYKILIANPSAAREGLTLTKANNAIYLDRNFNLVDYLQSQDRIHRISQEKNCNIYKLITKNSIDEYVDKVIEVKRSVAQFIQGDLNELSNEVTDFYLNKKYLLEMLGGYDGC